LPEAKREEGERDKKKKIPQRSHLGDKNKNSRRRGVEEKEKGIRWNFLVSKGGKKRGGGHEVWRSRGGIRGGAESQSAKKNTGGKKSVHDTKSNRKKGGDSWGKKDS